VNRTHQDTSAPALSRRSLLQGTAAAGLAATAVTALGAAVTGTVTGTATGSATGSATGTATGTGTGSASGTVPSATAATPLVVHVRDINTGDIEVFSGTSQTRVRDRALAARISRAIS